MKGDGRLRPSSNNASGAEGKEERKQTTQGRDGRTARRHHTGILGEKCGASRRPPALGVYHFLLFAVSHQFSQRPSCHLAFFPLSWSTWSAVINRTSRAGELRSAPSGPDDWHRVAGKRALALGGARLQGKGRKVNTGLRGLAPRTGFPLNCRTPPRSIE